VSFVNISVLKGYPVWLKSVLYQVVGALKMISNFVGQMNPEWITAMATSLTAIYFIYEIWKKRPSIEIGIMKDITEEMKDYTNSAIYDICIAVRNKSKVPLSCKGYVITEKNKYPLFDWYEYKLRHSESTIESKFFPDIEPFRFFNIDKEQTKYLFGKVGKSSGLVKVEIRCGKKRWSKTLSLG